MADAAKESNITFSEWFCPLCHSENNRIHYHTKDFNCGMPGSFTYVSCNNCRLVRLNPRPDDQCLSLLYPPYYGRGSVPFENDLANRIHTPANRFRANMIKRFKNNPGLIFDIGCGSGFFLKHMESLGWQILGLDSAEEHVAYARRTLNLGNIWCSIWPSDLTLDGKADVVSMIHLLEHLSDPIAAISRAKHLLKDDGLLIVETPNIESWPMSVFGKYSTQLDAPRHLCLFSTSSLACCAKKAGLEVIALYSFSSSTMEYRESLRYWIKDHGFREYKNKVSRNGIDIVENDSSYRFEYSRQSGLGLFLIRLLQAGEETIYRLVNKGSEMMNGGSNLLMVARSNAVGRARFMGDSTNG